MLSRYPSPLPSFVEHNNGFHTFQVRAGFSGPLDLFPIETIDPDDGTVSFNPWKIWSDDPVLINSVVHTLASPISGSASDLQPQCYLVETSPALELKEVTFSGMPAAVTRVTDLPEATQDAIGISVNGLLTSSPTAGGITYSYGYDDLGRRSSVTDPRTGTSLTVYNDKGQVDYTQDAAGNRTIYSYDDETGRRIAVTDANSVTMQYDYDSKGRLWTVSGENVYPVEYGYDDYDRKTTMTTFRDGTGDTTIWVYEEASGLLLEKVYADGQKTSYSYTEDGKLSARVWARGVTTSYLYDAVSGDLSGIDYSDDTPDVTFSDYDSFGRPHTVIDGIGTHTLSYDGAHLLSESVNGATVTHSYENGRLSGVSLGSEYSVVYGYDPATGRMASVTAQPGAADEQRFSYGYLQNSELIETVTSAGGLSVTRSYETQRNLLTGVANSFNNTLISQYDYGTSDALGRRTGVSSSGTAFEASGLPAYSYGYNARSEVTGAARSLGGTPTDPTAPPAFDFSYAYDSIGNRTQAVEWDGASKTSAYSSNALNQYPTIQSSGSSVQLTYDLDGNLTQDGTFQYGYDAENRLIAVTPLDTSSGLNKVEFSYDYQHRLIGKQVSEWQTDDWSLLTEHWYVYDGWNLIRETTATDSGTSMEFYVWGLDLSGSLQGAGGIGGLLMRQTDSGSFLYLYEANGNVGQLVDAATGSIAAHYEYGPFGNTLVASGSEANNNPFRFSTKYVMPEFGWYDYGRRYYSPTLGRWPTRDPIEEDGGRNLYGFVGNNPIDEIDALGLFCSGARPYTETTYGVGNSEFDTAAWTAGKHLYWGTLAQAAMDRADCTISGDWILSPAECEQTEHQLFNYAEDCAQQTTCKSKRLFAEWFEDYIYSNYNYRPPGSYNFQITGRIIRFATKLSAQYFAYGKAELTFTGIVHLCKNWWGKCFNIDMEVKLSDDFTFSWYKYLGTSTLRSPTAIGYRLETSGYLRRFNTMGKWKKENMYAFCK